MGTVYLAEHTSSRAKVAIKVLRAELGLPVERVDRVLSEMVGTARARHERLVETIESGRTQDGDAFLVMEYVDGQPLNACLPVEGAFDLPRATSLVLQILEGLEAAHGRGLIHRDLRPENIFLQRLPDGGDAIKIADFGLTRLLEGEPAEANLPAAYLPPEQCRGKGDVDARADLYSVGCIYYFLLTREPPFVGKDDEEVRRLHLQAQPPSLRSRNAAVPQALEQVLMACLAKSPDERFQSATALSRALREAAQQFGLRGPSRPPRPSQPNLGSVLRAQPLGVTAPLQAQGQTSAQAQAPVQVHAAGEPVPAPVSRTVSGVAMLASGGAPVIAMPAESSRPQAASVSPTLGTIAFSQGGGDGDGPGGGGGDGSGRGGSPILMLVLSLALLASVVGNVLLIGVISRRTMDTPSRPILMESAAQREERPAPAARTEEPAAADRIGPGLAMTRTAAVVAPRQTETLAPSDLAAPAARAAVPDAGMKAAAQVQANANANLNTQRPARPDMGAGKAVGAAATPAQAGAPVPAGAQAPAPDLRAKMVEVDRMLERGQFGPAREILERMLPEHSERPEVFERLGACAVAQRRYQAAEEYYERALDLKPDYAAAFIGLADLAERRGNDLHALEWYRQYMRDAPQGPYAKLAQGRIRKLEKLESPKPDAAGRDMGAQEGAATP